MPLIETIRADQFTARKQKDSLKTNLLTSLIADIVKIGKDKDNREATEEEALLVIKKYLKSIDENLSLNLPEDSEKQFIYEKDILLSYLPKQATEKEIKAIVVANIGKPKGEVFKALKEKFGNNYDAKLASTFLV